MAVERAVVCVLVSALACLQLCAGSPVTSRESAVQLWERESRERGDDLCYLCEVAVGILKDYLENNAPIEEVDAVMEPVCLHYMNKSKGYNGQYMCPGIVKAYIPIVVYVITESDIKPTELCSLIHLCNDSSSHLHHSPPLSSLLTDSWDGWKKPYTGVRQRQTGEGRDSEKMAGKGDDPIVFLQLSDIHLDLQFSEGSPSVCNLYLCCRSWYNGTSPAGHYGDINCDLPLVTLEVIADAISQLDPQPDFILYTGDNSPHNVWNQTWSKFYDINDFLFSFLAQRLPHRHIYPALGNHEANPESEYLGTLPQYQELTKKMAAYWQELVPLPQSAVETITDGAYYTTLIQDKLRVLSFNSDYGYTINFYSHLNDQNPYYSRQQTWIMDTLQAAEKAGEKVIMMAHVPPGYPENTLKTYEEFYLNLTRRYQDTIVAHLFGHTHHDEFKLIQDDAGVYGTVLICPSVTPYGRSNPSFRLFSMDPSSYQLLGYQQFHLNLTLANEMASKGIKPKVELAYTTSDLYNLPDLSPTSWAGLVDRFSDYPELVSDYRYNIYGQTSTDDRSCDQQCLRQTICTVSNILSSQRTKCLGS